MSETQSVATAPALSSGKPLSIVVTQEGSEFVKLRALALEAIPMLLRPRDYSQPKREQIAQDFRSILEDDCSESDSDTGDYGDEENGGYEPGECLDWFQGEED